MLQVARFLLQALRRLQKGKKLGPSAGEGPKEEDLSWPDVCDVPEQAEDRLETLSTEEPRTSFPPDEVHCDFHG